MNEKLKHIEEDTDGMGAYDYIVNNVDVCIEDMPELIAHLKRVDHTGQFLASSARFLAAVDRERFESIIEELIEGAIDKDRERRYIGSLLEAIWGKDFRERTELLQATDNNFRRIFKRIYPEGIPFSMMEDE